MSESIDLLLTNGTVVTMDAGGNVFLDGAVAIRGRAIIAVGTAAELAERYDARETRDCRGCAIIPGLIQRARACADGAVWRGRARAGEAGVRGIVDCRLQIAQSTIYNLQFENHAL